MAWTRSAGETSTTPDGLVDLAGRDHAPRAPVVRMLGAFDPLLLGWADRDGVLGAHRQVVTTNGVFRPVVLVDGRVVATWGLPGGTVTVDVLGEVPPSARPSLDAEVATCCASWGCPPARWSSGAGDGRTSPPGDRRWSPAEQA